MLFKATANNKIRAIDLKEGKSSGSTIEHVCTVVLTLSGKILITDPVHVRDVTLPFGDQFMRQRPPIVAPQRARAMYALDKIVKLNYYWPSNGGTVLANYLRMPEIARRRAYLSILADRSVLCVVDSNTCRYILPG